MVAKLVSFALLIFTLGGFNRSFVFAQDDCKDLVAREDCAFYAQGGQCDRIIWVQQNCAKTCKLCQPRAILYFARQPSSLAAVERKNATLHCKANTSLVNEIIYFWKFNQTYVYENDSHGITFSEDGSEIHIRGVNETKHRGIYECIALSIGTGSIKSIPASLQIAYFKIEAQQSRVVRVELVKPFLLEIPKYDALPSPEFIWEFKDASNQFVSVSRDSALFVTERGDLFFPSVTQKHITTFRIFIKHKTTDPGYAVAFLYNLRGRSNPSQCADSRIFAYPTIERKVARIGENITFECLAVAKDCRNQISISWSKQDTGTHISSKRRLSIYVVHKGNEGTYVCDADLTVSGSRKTFLYTLQVIEKPKLTQAIDVKINLTADGLVSPAKVKGVTSFSWYKDGEAITNSSSLFEVYPGNRLKIKNPSRGVAGFYQMFYGNKAGVVDVTLEVAAPKVGCGWTTHGNSGTIEFYNPDVGSFQELITCNWLVQLPSTRMFQFEFLKMDFPLVRSNCSQANVSLYSGSTASKASISNYCANSASLSPVVHVRGPFITIQLKTERKYLHNGGFLVQYGPVSKIPSTDTPTRATDASPSKSQKITTTIQRTTQTRNKATTVIISRKKVQQKSRLPIAAICAGVIGGLAVVAIVAVICLRKDLMKKIIRPKPVELSVKKESLPRFDVEQSDHTGIINHSYQATPRPSYSDLVPEYHDQSLPGSLGAFEPNTVYDAVGGIISNGLHDAPEDGPGIYDVVGGVVKGCQKDDTAIGVQNVSKSSSTKSEPYYHQLADGNNIAYESAGNLKSSMKSETNSTLSSSNAHDFARIPSGRSDAQYTPLENDSPWASKENSIYESLTLDRVKGASLELQKNELTSLGEYCDPFEDKAPPERASQDRSFRGESCALYESGGTLSRLQAGVDFSGEYCVPYDPPSQNEATAAEQLYSEPL